MEAPLLLQTLTIEDTVDAVSNDAESHRHIQEIEKTNNDAPPPQWNLDQVEAILGYKFNNKYLLEEAFTHPSYKCDCSFERLEYVGDAVLNILITNEQFYSYPKLPPGQLTQLRAANVNTEKLARVAITHGLHHYLRHKKPRLKAQIDEFTKEISDYPLLSNGLIDVPKDLADIVESTIGAVFIDCGSSIDIVWKIFKSLLEPRIEPNTFRKHPVMELYEFCQKKKLKIQFEDLWKESKTVNVHINEKIVGIGTSGTKKEIAHNRAAKNALDNIERVLNIKMSTNEDAIVD